MNNLTKERSIQRYTKLVNGMAFHIHEVANGSKWDNNKWFTEVYLPYHYGFNNSLKVTEIGPITTILGDTIEATIEATDHVAKYINGKKVH